MAGIYPSMEASCPASTPPLPLVARAAISLNIKDRRHQHLVTGSNLKSLSVHTSPEKHSEAVKSRLSSTN
eukprot:scaffold591872_cov18-Prasinocladus_malaysianus.AAC.1